MSLYCPDKLLNNEVMIDGDFVDVNNHKLFIRFSHSLRLYESNNESNNQLEKDIFIL